MMKTLMMVPLVGCNVHTQATRMLRNTARRMGHQLIKEPLGNEHNTLARGHRTLDNLIHELKLYAVVAGSGILLGGITIVRAMNEPAEVIPAPPSQSSN